jgi:hypothetical protein
MAKKPTYRCENLVSVTVLNWAKHNPRSDIKRPTWFSLSNSLIEDDEFFDFSHAEFKVWIYILSKTSQKQSSSVELRFDAAKRKANLKPKEILSALHKLSKLGHIKFEDLTDTLRSCDEDVTETSRGRHATNRQTDKTIQDKQTVAEASGDATHPSGSPTPPRSLTNPEGSSPTALTWRAYKASYEARWGNAPPWNAKMAGQFKSLVARIPSEDAPEVARFFLTHNDRFYVKSMHPVGLLLRDAEKIYTEWKTNRKLTESEVRSAESSDHYLEQMRRLGAVNAQ